MVFKHILHIDVYNAQLLIYQSIHIYQDGCSPTDSTLMNNSTSIVVLTIARTINNITV
jgi:hypothetical protein